MVLQSMWNAVLVDIVFFVCVFFFFFFSGHVFARVFGAQAQVGAWGA